MLRVREGFGDVGLRAQGFRFKVSRLRGLRILRALGSLHPHTRNLHHLPPRIH